ncbi:MAG: hypothetical protein ACI95C_002366 [Pseudohongiellaceae bacterium]|jgi:hypothetical protein
MMLLKKLYRIKLAQPLGLLSWLVASSLFAQSNYSVFELRREDNWDTLIHHDMNGDGLNDLIYSNFSPATGRELHILHQQPDGSFNSNPVRIEIKTEIIAVGFADLRADPGIELVLFAGAGVFSLSTAIAGYAGNLKPLLQWELIASVPDLEQLQFIDSLSDINADGYIDLVLPGASSYGVFLGGPNETFSLSSVFDTSNEELDSAQRRPQDADMDARLGINAEQGVVVEVTLSKPSVFSDFVEQWDVSTIAELDLLRTDTFTPSVLLTALNADEKADVIYLNVGEDGLGQINIHYQSPDSQFAAEPDWTGSLDTQGELQLVDVNGDGASDLVTLAGNGNDWDAKMYLNQNGQFDFATPSQVMRFSGYDVNLNFVQLSQANKPVLSVNYYTIPVVDAIRSASINRVQLLYGFDQTEASGIFNRRPSMRLEESFSAANVLGLSEQMALNYDINGDGKADAVYVTENGTLAAKSVNADLTLSDSSFWEYISPRTVFEFEVLALNNDKLPDLILRHGTSTSILVARP